MGDIWQRWQQVGTMEAEIERWKKHGKVKEAVETAAVAATAEFANIFLNGGKRIFSSALKKKGLFRLAFSLVISFGARRSSSVEDDPHRGLIIRSLCASNGW